MGFENIRPLGHYSFCDVPSVYDEESLTALELAARTAAKVNEAIKLGKDSFKKQDTAINTAVQFMKDNLDESLHELAYEMAENGELEILSEENYNNMKKHLTTVINVKECGAVGDGVTDDTNAFRHALTLGYDIFVPAGTYLITNTITVDDSYTIHGEGMDNSIIKYTGANYLLNATSYYANRATVEKLGFIGTEMNGFIKCSREMGWGASVNISECSVKSFGGNMMRFESAFMCDIANCIFDSASAIIFTTYDGSFTEDNFSNCILFKNCLMVGVQEQAHPAFELNNVRLINFESCTFEHINTLLKCVNKTRTVKLTNCWYENINLLFDVAYWCDNPVVENPNFVNIEKYIKYGIQGGYYDVYNHVDGAPYIMDLSGGDNAMATGHSVHKKLAGEGIYNTADAYSQYYYPYEIYTDKALFNMPLNHYYVKKTHADNTAMPTQVVDFTSSPIGRPTPSCSVYYKIKLILTYADGDYITYGCDVLKDDTGVYKFISQGELNRTTWSGSAGNSDTVNFTITDNGRVEYSTSGTRCTKSELLVEWNICGNGG